MTRDTEQLTKRPRGFTAKGHIRFVLEAVAEVHGVEVEAILGSGDVPAPKEVQRAKNQFRYIISSQMGIREGARQVECAPATMVYVRKVHKKLYKKDFYYTELFNQIKKILNT